MSEKKGKSEFFGWYVFAACLFVILVVESLLLIGILKYRCDHRTPYPQKSEVSPHKSFPSRTNTLYPPPNESVLKKDTTSLNYLFEEMQKNSDTINLLLDSLNKLIIKKFYAPHKIELEKTNLIKTRLEADRDSLSFRQAIEYLKSGWRWDSVSYESKMKVYLLEDFSR